MSTVSSSPRPMTVNETPRVAAIVPTTHKPGVTSDRPNIGAEPRHAPTLSPTLSPSATALPSFLLQPTNIDLGTLQHLAAMFMSEELAQPAQYKRRLQEARKFLRRAAKGADKKEASCYAAAAEVLEKSTALHKFFNMFRNTLHRG